MSKDVRQFVVETLEEMNYDVEGLTDETTLGPAGVDLESLALAELAVRVEEEFGVKFNEDESEQMAVMTVGEFSAFVNGRLAAAQ
ncbi:acyl carrier protein [Longispora albida]|uniref:acyl carrier protein n=1 Tax=Longispora albida TaxID=203523 RepID=UPI00036B9AD1|nr:acyl carrier protein [Longispora albida]